MKTIEFMPGGFEALETDVEYFLLQISDLALSGHWLMSDSSYKHELRTEQYTKISTIVEAMEDKLKRVSNYVEVLQMRKTMETHDLEELTSGKS